MSETFAASGPSQPKREFSDYEKLYHAADAVKMRFWDDAPEYSDAERWEALHALFDAMSEDALRRSKIHHANLSPHEHGNENNA